MSHSKLKRPQCSRATMESSSLNCRSGVPGRIVSWSWGASTSVRGGLGVRQSQGFLHSEVELAARLVRRSPAARRRSAEDDAFPPANFRSYLLREQLVAPSLGRKKFHTIVPFETTVNCPWYSPSRVASRTRAGSMASAVGRDGSRRPDFGQAERLTLGVGQHGGDGDLVSQETTLLVHQKHAATAESRSSRPCEIQRIKFRVECFKVFLVQSP
jgi:hypothetical protein